MVSGRTILPVSNNDSTYTFNGLAANTSHNVTAILLYNALPSNFRMFNESIKTLVPGCEFNCYFNASSYVKIKHCT